MRLGSRAWLVYCVTQNDRSSRCSRPSIVGQLGKLRPIVNRPSASFRGRWRRLPTAAQDAILPHAITTLDNTAEAPHYENRRIGVVSSCCSGTQCRVLRSASARPRSFERNAKRQPNRQNPAIFAPCLRLPRRLYFASPGLAASAGGAAFRLASDSFTRLVKSPASLCSNPL